MYPRITVTAAPANYTGPCPVTITFTAQVVMNEPGSVVYRWERSDGAIDTLSHPPIVFHAAGSQTVTTTWKLGAPIPQYQPFNGWRRFRANDGAGGPLQPVASEARFVLNCQSRSR